MQFEHCLQTSRGHDRDVDVCLLIAIVFTKQHVLSRVGNVFVIVIETTTRRANDVQKR